MRILLVEDDEPKRLRLLDFLSDAIDGVEVAVARSYRSGLDQLVSSDFDLVVLDMTIPTYDVSPAESGGRPQPFGGKELLSQMARRGVRTPALVVTQYERFGEGIDAATLEDVNGDLRAEFGEQYLGSVYYSPASDQWQPVLGSILESL